jgi:monoamine oxidase
MTLTKPGSSSVVVIGAGLAGLTAARRLAAAGVAVTVVEARDHVGGRTHTVRDGLAAGQHCDFGGELVTSHYPALVQLCAELGVELSEPVCIARPDTLPSETRLEGYLAEGRVIVGGELLTGARFKAVDDELRTVLRHSPPAPQESTAQWTRRARLSSDARGVVAGFARLIQFDLFQNDAGFMTETHVEPARRIVGGTQKLANALARELDVRLNSPVRTVRQARGTVEVELESGERLTAPQVVVAVPAFVLPTIGFDPPLPAAQLGALTSLQRSWGGKVIGQYAEGDAVRAVLSSPVFTDGPINTAWVSNPYVKEGPAVVAGFVCGTQRHILESEQEAVAALDAVVQTAVGAPVTRIASLQKNWTTDPFALGVVPMPGYAAREAFAALFATPRRRLHFAGDYSDAEAAGTLEGAVRSGRRAADTVLRLSVRMPLATIESELVRA